MIMMSPRYHSICGRGVPVAVQVRVRGSPAVSIGLLFTGSLGDSGMVGVTAEYVHYRKEALCDCALCVCK